MPSGSLMDHAPTTDAELAARWRDDGYVVVPAVWSQARVARVGPILEHVLDAFRARDLETGEPAAPAHRRVLHPNHPAYLGGNDERRIELLTACADPRVLAVPRLLFGEEPLFRSLQFWFNPLVGNEDGNWHRDSQFLHPDLAEEQRHFPRLASTIAGAQFQIALVANDDIEYVPGSHRRWDTDEEFRIRRADGAANWCSNAMPGAVRVALRPGDGVLFNPFGLHRGRYYADRPRRTLMTTMTPTSKPMSDTFSRQPWFLEPGHLAGLDGESRAFYQRFIDTYAGWWRGGPAVGDVGVGY